MLDTARFLLPSVAYRHAVRGALAGEFPPADLERLLQSADAHRRSLSTSAVARQRQAPGVRFIMVYFHWGLGLYRALLEQGWSAERAGTAIEAIHWTIFEPASRIQFAMSRLAGSAPLTRAKWILDLLFMTIFARPYRREILPARDAVNFNVTACPLAALYIEQGAPELARYAACSLDYRMARLWGVDFVRTMTLAEGHSCCDFRFREMH